MYSICYFIVCSAHGCVKFLNKLINDLARPITQTVCPASYRFASDSWIRLETEMVYV